MTRAGVIGRLRRERAAFDRVIDGLPEEAMERPSVAGEWSAKDVIAHVMAFERWTAAQIRSSATGVPATVRERYDVDVVPDGIEESDQETFNAIVARLYRDWPAARVQESAGRAFEDLVQAIEALDETDLTDGSRFGWSQGLTLEEIVARQTWRHYALHLPALREPAETERGLRGRRT